VNKVGKRRLLDIGLKESGEVTTMGSNEEICLHWNDFNINIRNTFVDLKEDKDFADVTLVCGDGQTDAHKVILSAGSLFFQKILKSNPHSKPLVYLKGVKFRELKLVLSFIYKGEATVAMADVGSFLAVAEDLEVKGLSKEYMSDGTSDQFGRQTQPAGPASLSTFPLTANLNQQQTSANNNIKAEEQLEQLGGLVESGQAEASQELDYDDYNQNEDYNQYQADQYQQDAEKGDSARKGRGRRRASSGPVAGFNWQDLEQHTVHLSGKVNKGQHQCVKCDRIFSRKRSVLEHVMAHHAPAGTFEFNCDDCNKKFDTPQKLKDHRSTRSKKCGANVGNK